MNGEEMKNFSLYYHDLGEGLEKLSYDIDKKEDKIDENKKKIKRKKMTVDKQRKKKLKEFHKELIQLIIKYDVEKNNLEPFDIMDILIENFKTEASLIFGCYNHALGFCTKLLTDDFEKTFYEVKKSKEKIDESNSV